MATNKIQDITPGRGGQFRNVLVTGTGVPGSSMTDGFLAFLPATALADLPSDVRAFAFQSTTPKYWDGSGWNSFGSGGSTPSWETLFANDATFGLTSGTWTITQSSANAILTLNKTNVGAGAVIDITNSGSGADIKNSTNWSILASGGVGVLELGSTGSINVTAGALSIGKTGTATTLLGTLTVAEAVTFTSGGVTVTSGNVTLSSGNLGLTSGTFTVSAGVSTLIATSNTAPTLLLTNNTATSYGVGGTSTGVVLFRSTSLTTGTLQRLQLTEGTLNGGYYFDCWDVTAGAAVFKIAEDGVTTIAGVGGSNVLTLTAGDAVMSDGSLTITDADNAATFSVTNDTATTASPFVFAGSGAFTGTTTTSFMTVTASGLTTGTLLYLVTAAATTLSKVIDISTSTTTGKGITITMTGTMTGVGSALEIVADSATTPGASVGEGIVKVSADGLTTGTALDVTSTSIGLTSGRLADFSAISGNITGTLNKTGDLFSVVSTRTVTTGTVADDFDMVSLIRTGIINGGGSFSKTGSVLYVENVTTNTSGTITDTTNGIEVVMDADGTGDALNITSNATGGKSLNVTTSATTATVALLTANSLTGAGIGLSITNTGTGLTSGSLIRVSTGSTGAVATNGVVSVRATGAYTSTSNVGLVDILASGLTGAGTVVRIAASAASQTASELLRVVASGYTTGYSGVVMNVIGCATTGAAATTHSVLTITGANTTGGNMLQLSNNALTTGVGMIFAHTTSVIADGGSMLRLSSSSVDTGGATNGTILDIGSTGAQAATLVKITDTALTSGTGMVHSHSAMTTGIMVSVVGGTTLTSGNLLKLYDNSADTTARGLLYIVNDAAASTGATPILIQQDAVVSTNYRRLIKESATGITIWMGNGTTANGSLSGTAGDILINGGSNKPEYCTGTTNWTALV